MQLQSKLLFTIKKKRKMMKISRLVTAVAVLLLMAANGSAAVILDDAVEVPFVSYEKYVNGSFGVDFKMPKGFVDGRYMGLYKPALSNGGTGIAWAFGAMLQSADRECAVLMPTFGSRVWDMLEESVGDVADFTQCETYWAVKGAVWYEYLSDQHDAIDMTRYVKRINARRFNADTAVVVTLPANDSVMGQYYTHRNFLVLKKAGRPVVTVNVLLTDSGVKRSGKYIETVWRAVKYSGKAGWHYDPKVADRLRNENLKEYDDYYGQFLGR